MKAVSVGKRGRGSPLCNSVSAFHPGSKGRGLTPYTPTCFANLGGDFRARLGSNVRPQWRAAPEPGEGRGRGAGGRRGPQWLRGEYAAINSMLDQINSCLDHLEEKNDHLHARLKELLECNRQTRLELQQLSEGEDGENDTQRPEPDT
uniref:Uncharacterized protein n=1 Tax=Podarcis muralis TaxID=64176 RepID=A0A670KKJ6_PODMU